MLNIGLIGCGIWGTKVLNVLIEFKARVHVLEVNEQHKEFVLKSGASTYKTSFDEWNRKAYDGIIIASTTKSHISLLRLLKTFDNPIFVEKPIVGSKNELEELKQLNLSNVFVMHIWKYHGGINKLSEIAVSGQIGEVKQVKSVRANWTSPRKDTDSLWNLAVHDLSICETILGEIPSEKKAIAEVHDGRIRGLNVWMGKSPFYSFEVSNRYMDKRREVIVFGTEGVARLQDEKSETIELFIGDDKSSIDSSDIVSVPFDTSAPLKTEIKQFLNYILGGKPPKTDLLEGIRLVKHIIEIENLVK